MEEILLLKSKLSDIGIRSTIKKNERTEVEYLKEFDSYLLLEDYSIGLFREIKPLLQYLQGKIDMNGLQEYVNNLKGYGLCSYFVEQFEKLLFYIEENKYIYH